MHKTHYLQVPQRGDLIICPMRLSYGCSPTKRTFFCINRCCENESSQTVRWLMQTKQVIQSESQKGQRNRGVGAPGGRSRSPRHRQCSFGLMRLATMGLFHPQLHRSTFTLIMSLLCVRNVLQCFHTLKQYFVTLNARRCVMLY